MVPLEKDEVKKNRGNGHIKKTNINKTYSHTDSLIHTNMDLVSSIEEKNSGVRFVIIMALKCYP